MRVTTTVELECPHDECLTSCRFPWAEEPVTADVTWVRSEQQWSVRYVEGDALTREQRARAVDALIQQAIEKGESES